MKKVLEKFKNLYKGTERLKRHAILIILFILPALAGGMRLFFDKDTPKEILIPAFLILSIILLLSIIPGFFLSGFHVDFYLSRIKSQVGLPKITAESFIKGLKIFPLHFVWGFYCFILAAIICVFPAIILFINMNQFVQSSNYVMIILSFIGIFLLYILLIVVFLILAPFLNYIYCSFVEDFVYRGEYFNPLTLFVYIKQVFKETMITMLKFLLANIIINTILQMTVGMVIFMLAMFVGITSAASETFNPLILIILFPVCVIGTIIQMYVTQMTMLAATDAYVDIYKEYIRIADPAECNNNEMSE